MVPKLHLIAVPSLHSFRAVLFRMVPKRLTDCQHHTTGFRAVLFRMVPKPYMNKADLEIGFRAVLFRMVPKLQSTENAIL